MVYETLTTLGSRINVALHLNIVGSTARATFLLKGVGLLIFGFILILQIFDIKGRGRATLIVFARFSRGYVYFGLYSNYI